MAGRSSTTRRKLNFDECQRFKGKRFFLDLSGYRRAKEIEKELATRGATVESFFDKSIRYLITNKSKEDIHKATSPNTGQSPRTPSTGGLSQLISPYSPHSTSDKNIFNKTYFTRAQKMLQMSLQNNTKSYDILTQAASWKCKIIHVDTVEKELKKLKPVQFETQSKKTGFQSLLTATSVRKLHRPFMKVEDVSGKYCPIIYEPSKWPMPNPDCKPGTCPFDPPNTTKAEHVKKVDHQKGKLFDVKDKKGGYCERCAMRYADIEEHLKCTTHREYEENPKNFESLDQLISEVMSFGEFINQISQQLPRNNASLEEGETHSDESDHHHFKGPPEKRLRTNVV